MADSEHTSRQRQKSRPIRACCGCAVAIPLIAALILVTIFQANNQPPDIVIPTPKMPADNGYAYFVRAGEISKAMRNKAPVNMEHPPTDPATLLKVCKACKEEAGPLLQVIHQALRKEYLHPPERSFDAYDTNVSSGLRDVERQITGVAQYYELRHQPDSAVDTLLDGLELAVTYPRGGTFLDGLVGDACEAISTSRIEPSIYALNARELSHVASRLDQISRKRVPYTDLLTEEANSVAASYIDEFGGPKNPKKLYDEIRSLEGVGPGEWPTIPQAKRMVRFAFTNKARMVKECRAYVLALAEEARGPYTGHSNVKVPENPIAEEMDYLVDGRQRSAVREAVLAVLRVEVALLRYRADHRTYPDRLQALVPRYLARLPDDPCAGKGGVPLRYVFKKGGQGFLLYSLGPDLIDGGGTPGWNFAIQGGDIVASKIYVRRKSLKGF